MLAIQRTVSRSFLVLLALPATAMGFAISVQVSALSWILSTQYGLHIEDIGLVWAAGPFAGIVGQLACGFISDGVWAWNGRRRVFIVIGGALTALMILALPCIGVLAHSLQLGSILGVAIAVALGLDLSVNISLNPTRAIITDVTREGAQRTRGYTWMQTVSGTFGVLAYAIGALLGNHVLIYCAAALVLAFSILPAFLIEEPRTMSTADSNRGPPTLSVAIAPTVTKVLLLLMPLWGFALCDLGAMALKIVGVDLATRALVVTFAVVTALAFGATFRARDRGVHFVRQDLVEFRKVLAANSFSWVAVQTMFVYMISFLQFRFPLLDDADTGRLLAMSFLVLSAVAAVLPATILGPFAQRFGQIPVHVACLAVMGLGFTGVYTLGYSQAPLLACMAVIGVGWAAIVSLPFAIMSQRVDRHRIGLYMGVFNLSVVLPQLFVSVVIGLVLGQLKDKGLMFLICAGAMGISAAAWLLVRRADGTEDDAEQI